MRVVVTGASGKAGRFVATDLAGRGHQVLATDIVAVHPQLSADGISFTRADLTDYGQALEILAGADAVAHLANIPAPDLYPPAHTLQANNAMNGNIFLAAAAVRLRRVVWASSETTLGLPFDVPPRYAPVDESHAPYPTTTYALSKVLAETMAEQVSSWTGIPFVGLRLSNVVVPGDPEGTAKFNQYWHDPHARKWNLWGYIDARDSASAFAQALESDTQGAQVAIIAADDTVMLAPSAELLHTVFPGVELTRPIEANQTLLANDHARQLFGWRPAHSWRAELVA